MTDPGCKRLGSQCWVYGAVMLTESLLCIKNGKELFGQTQAINIILWVLVMLLLSCLCVYGFVAWQMYFCVSNIPNAVSINKLMLPRILVELINVLSQDGKVKAFPLLSKKGLPSNEGKLYSAIILVSSCLL